LIVCQKTELRPIFREDHSSTMCDHGRPRRDHFSVNLRLHAIDSDQATLWDRSSVFREDGHINNDQFQQNTLKCLIWLSISNIFRYEKQNQPKYYTNCSRLFFQTDVYFISFCVLRRKPNSKIHQIDVYSYYYVWGYFTEMTERCSDWIGPLFDEMTKITNSIQSHKSYRKYKSEIGRTRTSEYIRGGIRYHGGVSIPCRSITLAVSHISRLCPGYIFTDRPLRRATDSFRHRPYLSVLICSSPYWNRNHS
jgi:hypothetical protein